MEKLVDNKIKHDGTTMCIVHKGFRGFRAVSPASVLGGNWTGMYPAIPNDFIPPYVVHNANA